VTPNRTIQSLSTHNFTTSDSLVREKRLPALFRALSVVVLLLLVALAFFGYLRPDWVLFVRNKIEPLGLSGIWLYLLVQTVWSLTTVPSIPLLVLAGLIYGPWLGSVLAVTGIFLGSALTFLIGRHLLTRHIARWRQRYPQLNRGIGFAERHDVSTLLVARTGPVFPLNLLNYALGATQVSFKRYLFVSFLASLPAAFIYAGLGEVLHQQVTHGELSTQTVLLIGIAIVLLSALGWMIRQRYAHQTTHDARTNGDAQNHHETGLPSSL